MKKYRTIYADPPWKMTGGGFVSHGYDRGANQHYKLMSLKEIIDMKEYIDSISQPNCHLYLWITNNLIQDGFKVMAAWEFKYITMITWIKNRIGMGQYFRGVTEHCLFGTKGFLPYKSIEGKRQQGRTGFYAKRKEHSQKPKEMRAMIEVVSYEPRIELFAREKHKDWDSWGDEV